MLYEVAQQLLGRTSLNELQLQHQHHIDHLHCSHKFVNLMPEFHPAACHHAEQTISSPTNVGSPVSIHLDVRLTASRYTFMKAS